MNFIGKLTTGFLAAITILITAFPGNLSASWAEMPMEEVVKASSVVVIGEIKRIQTADDPEKNLATAFITVERVLKNTSKNKVEVGAEIPLATPVQLRLSTDIVYKKGQKGVWILKFDKGKYWATYPKDFQEISEEAKITEIIKKQAAK